MKEYEFPDPDDRSTWPVEESEPWQTMTRLPPAEWNSGVPTWENHKYVATVQQSQWNFFGKQLRVDRLGVQRIDQRAVHDWRELQMIKNDICGPERDAIEVYPAESRLVDSSNYYLLWVFPWNYRMPFEINGGLRYVVDTDQAMAAQRRLPTGE